MKKSELKQIIKEEIVKILSENQIREIQDEEFDLDEFAEAKAKKVAGKFSKYISQYSEDITDGPDEEGKYDLEFNLAFDPNLLKGQKPKEFEKYLKQQINGYVSYNGYENGKHMFFVSQKVK
jgi:hypothetical protein